MFRDARHRSQSLHILILIHLYFSSQLLYHLNPSTLSLCPIKIALPPMPMPNKTIRSVPHTGRSSYLMLHCQSKC
ncbi:uncharacterized protein BDZ99DRAFT_211935 [Mytilinidion resinicola]|uniref:Uncharacterized protein n=1 Tax=Mytilinidion resinicola TaxID=574789 RepID=A0A6A6Y093_9PEZI|nr:uncharacterized protein BDZ99DRAFT_211935 [Mytilinidion resinicola]KAF2801968.1 hypothetical protein BDZ99DRAFT_211935 [Mytilinidion resinicola]